MKTLRAFLLGSALGALVGLILAPQRDAIAEAQLAEEAARREGTSNVREAVNRAASEPEILTGANTAPEAHPEPRVQGTPMERRYVGNLNTRIYHEATDNNLPNEENRTYFATPDEAEAAGYRPAQ